LFTSVYGEDRLAGLCKKDEHKLEWLESGYIALMQVAPEKVSYVDRDAEGHWVNRYVVATATGEQIRTSTYCLAPFNRSDAHEIADIGVGASWFRMAEPSVAGLKQVACEPKSRISRTEPESPSSASILGVCSWRLLRWPGVPVQ